MELMAFVVYRDRTAHKGFSCQLDDELLNKNLKLYFLFLMMTDNKQTLSCSVSIFTFLYSFCGVYSLCFPAGSLTEIHFL